jgi:molecular chaperone GrpE (heat shock protein)
VRRHENQNAAKVARAAVRAARKARDAHKDRLGRKQKELEQTQRSLDEAIEQAAEASQVRALFFLQILDPPSFEGQQLSIRVLTLLRQRLERLTKVNNH